MKYTLIAALAVAVLAVGCQSGPTTMNSMESSMDSSMDSMGTTEFTVTVEVVSGSPTPIAPVAWAVHTGSNPYTTPEMGHQIQGLESLAEDGNPSTVDKSVAMLSNVSSHGVAAIPDGANGAGPAGPGKAYSFTVTAGEGSALSFATMYVQSNDLFYSPGMNGIALFQGDNPVTGNVTRMVTLYDAGTEVNEAPGMGAHQAPRQSGPNMGEDEMGQVQPVSDVMDGFTYPSVSQVLRVTISTHM